MLKSKVFEPARFIAEDSPEPSEKSGFGRAWQFVPIAFAIGPN
jgi:hypothetical protein